MKTIIRTLLVIGIIAVFTTSCKKEEDEGNEMKIDFKTGTGFTSTDATLAGGTMVLIGVEAETEKAQDPIIKFNISESVNGAASTTIYSEDLESVTYEYDFAFKLDSVSGNVHKYTFTVTNRDGINAQKNLTLTVE